MGSILPSHQMDNSKLDIFLCVRSMNFDATLFVDLDMYSEFMSINDLLDGIWGNISYRTMINPDSERFVVIVFNQSCGFLLSPESWKNVIPNHVGEKDTLA